MGAGPHTYTQEFKPKVGVDMEFLPRGEGLKRGFVLSAAPGTGCWWIVSDRSYYKVAYRVLVSTKGKKVWQEVE